MIRDCNIRNYSIYLRQMDDGRLCLFSYFEYVGEDLDADMARMAADETTRKLGRGAMNAGARKIIDYLGFDLNDLIYDTMLGMQGVAADIEL